MAKTHILGYPRIGKNRELKFSLEEFWRGDLSLDALQNTGRQLRKSHWEKQVSSGLDYLSMGDFSFYDHVLDHTAMLGAAPKRYGLSGKPLELSEYFSLARGNTNQPAMEMTKWFDTNYHYIVPELDADTRFSINVHDFITQLEEANTQDAAVKPVLLGPVSYLYLAKSGTPEFDRLSLLEPLVHEYQTLLSELSLHGVEWVQMDEPVLALDLPEQWLNAFDRAYSQFRGSRPKLLLTTYFASVTRYAEHLVRLPVDGIHIDLIRAPEQLLRWLEVLPPHWILSAGVINGRNIWRNDLDKTIELLQPVADTLGDRLWLAPSCSLLHVPVSLKSETGLDSEIRSWMAFADEKMEELQCLRQALEGDDGPAMKAVLAQSRAAVASRATSQRVHIPEVQARLAGIDRVSDQRAHAYPLRQKAQQESLKLPLLPTTTIGSFPQTADIRTARAALKRGELGRESYAEAMRHHIRHAIETQESLGLDVLVHGEAERNDMVEFFGEQLNGYIFTRNGWVQSYGSRCVKPPVIYGDVQRPHPMTVETAIYAQSLTAKPVKGMLTGPVTLLQWSFLRDDLPRETIAMQLALCLRDEVSDLQQAGIRIIQIDEPALREGLPLQGADWESYLSWAVRAFRLVASVAEDATQIHTHMCYAEFNDILPAISAMDADVITIETSRSHMALLDAFGKFSYPNAIGPGLYDIHSPRVPSVEEMLQLVQRASKFIPLERLWINPDCGLKTRNWPETRNALKNMVEVAQQLRVL